MNLPHIYTYLLPLGFLPIQLMVQLLGRRADSSSKAKHRIIMTQGFHSKIHSRDMKTCPHRSCSQILIAAWFIKGKEWKWSKYPSTDEQISKLQSTTQWNILFIWRKECSTVTCYNMNEPWKHNTKQNNLVTEDHMLYYCIYTKYPDNKIYRDEVDERLLRAGGVGESGHESYWVGNHYGEWKCPKIDDGAGCRAVNVLNAIRGWVLLNGCIGCNVNYVSVKLFKSSPSTLTNKQKNASTPKAFLQRFWHSSIYKWKKEYESREYSI